MLLQLQNHLSQNLPFLQDKKLLLAVSGGVDSMVLTHLFKALNYNIAIAHCNFNLRGEESDGDENFIRSHANDNNIEIFVTHFDTASFAEDTKVSVQMAARQLRYAWFQELMEEKGFDYLLTAHHLDDSIETFLINFTRGTGLEGLTGIPQQNDTVIRPLLPFTRKEIENYAEENGIKWREDSSNASDKYMRNKLRHDIIPVLKSMNTDFSGSFKETLQHLQQAQSLVEDASVLVYKQVVTEVDGQKHINIEQLLRLPNYHAYLYQWLKPFSFTAWNDIYNLPSAQTGKQINTEQYRLLKNREILILEPINQQDNQVYKIEENQREVTVPIHLYFQKTALISNNFLKNEIYVNKELVKFPLFVRKWREGDYFYPFGMNGKKKKVSKFFKDEKMSVSEKENTWLLLSGKDIVWIVGRRADERFKVTENTTQILKIELL